MKKKTEIAVFGEGCFWCTEATLERLKGVITTTVGYAGGDKENPTYMDFENIATHELGHNVGTADLYDSSCSEGNNIWLCFLRRKQKARSQHWRYCRSKQTILDNW